MTDAPATDLDLWSVESLLDPYPLYEQLRALGPVVLTPAQPESSHAGTSPHTSAIPNRHTVAAGQRRVTIRNDPNRTPSHHA